MVDLLGASPARRRASPYQLKRENWGSGHCFTRSRSSPIQGSAETLREFRCPKIVTLTRHEPCRDILVEPGTKARYDSPNTRW